MHDEKESNLFPNKERVTDFFIVSWFFSQLFYIQLEVGRLAINF